MLKKLLDRVKAVYGNKKGFTLIEVVIVLAIAGLIFVIVFLAVSQAQAARRDTQRHQDANQYVAAVNQYAGNNGGSIPASAAQASSILTTYLPSLTSPSGTPYTVSYATTGTPGEAQLIDHAGAICSGNAMTATGAAARNFAVLYFQERGGTVCVDNH